MIKIVSLKIDKNCLYLVTDKDEVGALPCFCERISPEIWQYHSDHISFDHIEHSYLGKFDKLIDQIETDCLRVYDVLLFNKETETETFLQFEEDVDFDRYKTEIAIEIGNIFIELYKNASNGLSIRLKLIYSNLCKLLVKESENKIDLKISFNKPISLMLARRSTKKHDYSYDVKVFIPTVACENGYESTIDKKDMIPYCQSHNEIWDWIAIFDNKKIIPCIYDVESVLNHKFSINESFNVQMSSVDSCASIIVYEGDNKSQKKINIAILGSCFSKEAFHSVDYMNPDYKSFYNNSLLGFHQSLLAIESDPVEYDMKLLDGSCIKEIQKYSEMSFGKTFLKELKKASPDYLIIDLYIEAAAVVFETIDHSFITETYYYSNTSMFRNMNVAHKYKIGSEKRYELFKKSVDAFVKDIKGIIPERNVIIVRAQAALEKIENGIVSKWPEQQLIEFQRKIWERNDNYLISKLPAARIIDMRSEKYRSAHIGTLAFSRNHLIRDYYTNLLNKVNKIVLQDLLKQE